MAKGVLFGVGVGPGDPHLMTLKAIETIRRCPVVAAPRTGGGMAALDIAKGAVSLAGKDILPLDFSMSRDRARRTAAHRAAADLLRPRLDGGADVAMLNLGDVSIYSSYRYIADILGPEGYPLAMIPGVPSFCAAAAAFGQSLTDMEKPLRIVPEGDPSPAMASGGGAVVWMKSGRNLPRLLGEIRETGRMADVLVAQNCGMPDQRLYRGPEAAEAPDDYFTLVILPDPETGGGRP